MNRVIMRKKSDVLVASLSAANAISIHVACMTVMPTIFSESLANTLDIAGIMGPIWGQEALEKYKPSLDRTRCLSAATMNARNVLGSSAVMIPRSGRFESIRHYVFAQEPWRAIVK